MLKEIIDYQFKQNTDYKNPDQAVNQMQSLYALSKDLYTDSIRFIYELLQNADDSKVGNLKVKVSVRLFENKLLIAHTGKAFDERDIQGLCAVNNGTKKKEIDKTGFKGIGFKSVFGQSEKVIVFSDGEYFRFDANYGHIWTWEDTQQSWELRRGRSFQFPWQIIPIYTELHEIPVSIQEYLLEKNFTVATIIEIENAASTITAINELSEKVDMFLFLKHIEEIDFNVGTEKLIKITLTQENETALTLNGLIKAKYLLKNIKLIVPLEIKQEISGDSNVPEKLKLAETIEISLAAKIGTEGIEPLSASESLLYAYLPTEERKYYLPVLVNTAFLTTANRESLHTDSVWNQWIFNNISKELFIWIAELVVGKYEDQAYQLLPEKLVGENALAKEFNEGHRSSTSNLPFLLTYERKLIRLREAIIDETFLINNTLFGQDLIRNFIINDRDLQGIDLKPFVPHRKTTSKFKKLGVESFKWADLIKLLSFHLFSLTHTVTKNTELILLLKKNSEAEKPSEINQEALKKWIFLLDHKNQLKSPEEIFFPQIGDLTWNSPDSELSFIHPELQQWLDANISVKEWLVELGVVEKSDLTYFKKTILPNVSTFITQENALETIKSIFMLYKRNDINSDTLGQLFTLNVLTLNGTLIPASTAYFSSVYEPKLKLEELIANDFYLSESYLSSREDNDEWKRFFKYLGVREEISIEIWTNRTPVATLIAEGFDPDYFDLEDKIFKPWLSTFTADAYLNLTTLSLLKETITNLNFSRIFWANVINHISIIHLTSIATAYWGHSGRTGNTVGDPVSNYLKWHINQKFCLPTTNNTFQISTSIFLNDENIIEIVGNYLPIFDGPKLNADWRSFFEFKTKLELSDYLSVLESISNDSVSDNKSRIQLIYEYLLDNVVNWNSQEHELVKNWALTIKLLDQKGVFISAPYLKHYPDGDNSIFQDKFSFIRLNASNKRHSNISDLFELLGIEIMLQSSFKLNAINENEATILRGKISAIIPFWAKWTESEADNGYEEREYDLRMKFERTVFKNADELVIKFGENWSKKVNVYFKDDVFHVLTNWEANNVLLSLSEKLCEYFKPKRFESELGFLLRSTKEEIIEHFKMENIEIPEIPLIDIGSITQVITNSAALHHDFKKTIDYTSLWEQNFQRNKELIESTDNDPKSLLLAGLKQQKSQRDINIYHFSHLENAVAIIKEQQIKSRQSASFKDSAGSGIIGQTEENRKQYARFYFRSHTPTQFYVENWGKGQYSIDHINSDPVCPVPVFFIIPIEEAINESKWEVSLGTMASSNVEHGNSFEIVSKFDFDGVYKMKTEMGHDRYMVASHQEFLVKDSLNIENLNYRIAVQDESAKNSLLIMLNDNTKWDSRIEINTTLFYNENPKINITLDASSLMTSFNNRREGRFVLQYSDDSQWTGLKLDNINQYHNEGIITIITGKDISLSTNLQLLKYNLFYCYKGQLWLINTNNFDTNTFDTVYVEMALKNWMNNDMDATVLIEIFKMHPELNDWYNTSLGGPDNLTLEEHTLSVIKNHHKYFENSQKIFSDDNIFLIFLALHDIGKPKAISMGKRHDQHKYSLEIIRKIESLLSVSSQSIEMMKTLIDEDPIGKYLNPSFSESLETTCEKIILLQEKISVPLTDFWNTYLSYYQCDAAGYKSLTDKLFRVNDQGDLIIDPEKKRLVFKDTLEEKFQLLEGKINII